MNELLNDIESQCLDHYFEELSKSHEPDVSKKLEELSKNFGDVSETLKIKHMLNLRKCVIKEKLNYPSLLQNLETLCPKAVHVIPETPENLRQYLNKLFGDQEKIRRSKGNVVEYLNKFFHAERKSNKTLSSVNNEKQEQQKQKKKLSKVLKAVQQVSYEMNKKKEEDELIQQAHREQVQQLQHVIDETNKENEDIRNKVKNVNVIKRKYSELKQNNAETTQQLSRIRGTNYYKRVKRLEKNVRQKEVRLIEKNRKIKRCAKQSVSKITYKLQEVEAENKRLRHGKKILQTNISRKRQKLSVKATEIESLKLQIHALKESLHEKENEVRNLQQIIDAKMLNEIDTRTSNNPRGQFTDEIRQCVMEMISQQIGSNKISSAIETVARTLFGVNIEKTKLPSQSTIQNMAVESHFIGQKHIYEKLSETEHFDLHSDGTSRDGNKVLDFEATLSSGEVLRLGFAAVASEDSNTVLETTKQIIKDLAETSGDTINDATTILLTNLSALVGDRSSVVKAAHRKIDEWRHEFLLQATENEVPHLNFFYCLAHYLLGLSSQCEGILKEHHKTLELTYGRLGREALPIFRLWRCNESGVHRLIRTTCEALGPRGDQKSGCRAEWLTFMDMINEKSQIISYRGNRFNSLFDGAATVYYHAKHIAQYLNDHVKDPNKLLQSVKADIISVPLLAGIRSLGILSRQITLPFWDIVNSDTNVLDVHTQITSMYQALEMYANDATDLLRNDIQNVIPGFPPKVDNVFTNLYCDVDEEFSLLTKEFLELLCAGFLVVTQKQLADYLPYGKYSNCTEQEKQQAKHTQLTNLVGENDFGDYDSSCRQKPNASLRHHSGVIITKLNKTFKWLEDKSEEDKTEIMQEARGKVDEMREKHKTYAANVNEKRKEKLEFIKQKHEEQTQKKIRERQARIDAVHGHKGPCRNVEDVDELLSNCTTKKYAVLRDEIKYHQKVLEVNLKDRTVFYLSKDGKKLSIQELRNNLIKIIQHITPVTENEQFVPLDLMDEMRAQRIQNLKTSLIDKRNKNQDNNQRLNMRIPVDKQNQENQNAITGLLENESEQAEPVTQPEQDNILNLSDYIAVAYENTWYPGIVLKILDDSALVNFLHPVSGGAFRWSCETAVVDRIYIISTHLNITPAGNSGRTWRVENQEKINSIYEDYKAKYFQ